MPTGIYKRTKPPWNKGANTGALSEEHRKKIADALDGKKKSKEHAQHIGDSRKGIPRSQECIDKIRTASIGQRRSPATEFKKGHETWNRGMVGFMAGEENGNWKGGRSMDSYGYVLLECKNHPHARSGYVPEHRLVVESLIGRYLESHEEVHHINKPKTNNEPTNLMAFTLKKWHVKFEFGKPVPDGEIIFDGRNHLAA